MQRLASGVRLPSPGTIDAPIFRGQVQPYVTLAEEAGVPWRPSLELAGVPHDPEDPSFVITTRQLYRFINDLTRRGLGPDLGLMAAEAGSASAQPARLHRSVFGAPDLLQALCAARQHISMAGPTLRLWLHLTPTHLLIGHLSAARGEALGTTQTEIFRTLSIASLVQAFAGLDWRPPLIGLTAPPPAPAGLRSWIRDGRVVYGLPCGVIALPVELLRGGGTARAVAPPSTSDRPTLDLLEAVLPSMLAGGMSSIEAAAEAVGMAGRSLQRRLAEHGTSFRRILERVRLEEGGRLLRESEIPVKEIAHRLGYDEPTSFARAFRRAHGLSPSQVRRLRSGDPSSVD